MRYIIAVFKQRNDTMSYYNFLLSNGIKVKIINTPKQTMVTCGISVRFGYQDLYRVKQVTKRLPASFIGFYEVIMSGGRSSVRIIK